MSTITFRGMAYHTQPHDSPRTPSQANTRESCMLPRSPHPRHRTGRCHVVTPARIEQTHAHTKESKAHARARSFPRSARDDLSGRLPPKLPALPHIPRRMARTVGTWDTSTPTHCVWQHAACPRRPFGSLSSSRGEAQAPYGPALTERAGSHPRSARADHSQRPPIALLAGDAPYAPSPSSAAARPSC